MERVIQIEWTAPHLQEAKSLTLQLLDKRLIACAQLLPGVQSFYHWQGKIEQSQEVKVYLKTIERLYLSIEEFLFEYSSYPTPEILYTFVEGSDSYLAWIKKTSLFKFPSFGCL